MLALSNKNGTAKFYAYKNLKMKEFVDQLVGDGSLSSTINKSTSISTFEVKTDTLDNYVSCANLNQKIDLIKIDTEATEHLVFQGAENILTTHRPIIMCEIIKYQTEKELNKIFSSHQYEYYRIFQNGLEKTDHFIIDEAKEDYYLVPAEKRNLINDLIKQ